VSMASMEGTPPRVRFGMRPSGGLLLGLSAARLAAIGASAVLLVVGLVAAGGLGLVATAVVWLPLAGAAFVTYRGRPVIEWAPITSHWLWRRLRGQTRYRAPLLRPRPAGTMALPGDAAALRFYCDRVSGACMVHDPHRHTLSAVMRVAHPAYILLSPGQQHARVTSWGRVLAGLAHSGTCAAIQVLESTITDSGEATKAWFEANCSEGGTWAYEQYEQLLSQIGAGATTHRSTITLSLDMRRAGRAIRDAGRGMTGAAQVLRGDMTALEFGLRDAELRMDGWLDEDDLAALVRAAYDPAPPGGEGIEGVSHRLDRAGPTAVDEHWDCLRHDSGWSAVLWIAEWPRVEVPAHFLHGLVFVPEVRRSICLIARPLGGAEAVRQIRREKTEMLTDAVTKARIGQIADLADAQHMADLDAREQALICGHADLVFSGFVTITAGTKARLVSALSQVERAATAAGCETQVVYGAQAQAFVTAALPLGRFAG
jgi:Putative type VII ESX secretion system translocon, EccE